MYYYQPPQSNMPMAKPNYAQMQSWEMQRQREEAMEQAGRRYQGQGWDPVDAQRSGSDFKVHLCDLNGQYHTVMVDGSGRILQNQNGYR
jgi:hypothetical protein